MTEQTSTVDLNGNVVESDDGEREAFHRAVARARDYVAESYGVDLDWDGDFNLRMMVQSAASYAIGAYNAEVEYLAR